METEIPINDKCNADQDIRENLDCYAYGWGYTEISRTQHISNVNVEKGSGDHLSNVSKVLDLM